MAERAALDALSDERHATVFEAPRTVRLSLGAGDRVPAHRHPDSSVVCHVLDGRLAVELDDERYALGAGEVLRFDGRREVSPEAVTDVRALLVFCPRADER